MKMTVLASMADSMYEAVNKGDVDAVIDLLKRGKTDQIYVYFWQISLPQSPRQETFWPSGGFESIEVTGISDVEILDKIFLDQSNVILH